MDWRGSGNSLYEDEYLMDTKRPPTIPEHIRGSKPRRKGLRKRFRSLTEGLANFFTGDKKDSGRSSRENLKDPLGSKFVSEPDDLHASHSEDFPSTHNRQHSFSSFLSGSNFNGSENKLKRQKVSGQVKAPPSPPPRRYSSWLKEKKSKRVDTPLLQRASRAKRSSPNRRQPGVSPPPPPPVRLSSHLPSISTPSLPTMYKQAPESPHSDRYGQRTPSASPTRSRGPSPFARAQTAMPEISCTHESSPTIVSPTSAGGAVIERTISILLEKVNGTFGFSVRGGQSLNGEPRPFLITHVRTGGPADREGTLKAGDRLVAVDGRDLTRATLAEAQESLHEVEKSVTLTIKYDVSLMDSVRSSGNPLLVEIERVPGTSLGVTLTHAKSHNNPFPSKVLTAPLSICSVRTASIAERCGALAIGDYVAAIDGSRLEQSDLLEANQVLKSGRSSKITLEIIPSKAFACNGAQSNSSELYESRVNRFSVYHNYATQKPLTTTARRIQRRIREDHSISPGRTGAGVSRTETVRVTLMNDGRGIGLVLRPAPFIAEMDSLLPTIAAIDPGGSADQSGVICVGDHLLAVNGRNVGGLGVSEILQMMTNTCPTVILDLEFEVADSVVPSSGTFSVKLAKFNGGIGISIARGRYPKQTDLDDSVLISEVVRGSSSHRSGTLDIGDRVLAINNTRVDSLPLEEIRNLFWAEGDVVTLRVQKDSLYSDDTGVITYTVQLIRDGNTLGITASGGEEPFDPIHVAGLTSGSIAARTGAIHLGDRLLAINNVSLRGKPLSEAVRLLQTPDDSITLKISRPKEQIAVDAGNGITEEWTRFHGQPALSVDSAVESWDSSGLDVPCSSTPIQNKGDSSSDIYRSNCASTVRRRTLTTPTDSSCRCTQANEGHTWDSASPAPSVDSGQSEDKTDWDKMIADLNQISETCGLREKSNLATNSIDKKPKSEATYEQLRRVPCNSSIEEEPLALYGKIGSQCTAMEEGTYSVPQATTLHRPSSPPVPGPPITPTSPIQMYSVTLLKDQVYEDFGFSLSDGLYEKGVYINRIRKGGPADRTCLLKPYDRILQVNSTRTDDFDCCLTVPLIAAAEETLFLRVERSPPIAMRPCRDFRMTAWQQAEQDYDTQQYKTITPLQQYRKTAM